MRGFLPNKLLEEILREYLIIHWTDRFSSQNDYPHPQHKLLGGEPFRASELKDQHVLEIQDLLVDKYPAQKSVIQECTVLLNKLHAGNFISDTSYTQFIISLTRNDVLWYDTLKESYLSLPYNEPFELDGMTLSLPQLIDNSYYYLDVFVPKND